MKHLIYALFVPVLLAHACTQKHTDSAPLNDSRIISTEISNQAITAFGEDSLGHIWIGTLRGLNKHTVREFYQYYSTEDSTSLTHNQVSYILHDSRNRLWVATRFGVCLYTDRDCFERIPLNSDNSYVVQLLEDSYGKIFLSNGSQLCQYDEQDKCFRVVIPKFNADYRWSTRCFADKNGNLWSVSDYTITRYNAETLQQRNAYRHSDYIHYAYLQDNGMLWLVSGNQLSIFDTRNHVFVPVPTSIVHHPTLRSSIINLIAPYSDNSLLFNTSNGLFLYNAEQNVVIAQSEDEFPFAAPDFTVTGIFTDSKKNLWLGSADHGFAVVYSYRKHFNPNNYLASAFNHSVTAVAQDHNNNLWVVSPEKGVSVYDTQHGTIRTIDASEFLSHSERQIKNNIKYLFVDNDNYIWLIATTNRLFRCRFEHGRFTRVQDFWLPISVNDMMHDRAGTIYAVGTSANVYVLRKGADNFAAVPLYDSSRDYFMNQIKQLSDGHILVATFQENPVLLNSSGEVVKEIKLIPALAHSTFVPTVVLEDSRRNLWFGTFFNGVFRYSFDTDSIVPIPHISCPDVCSLEEDTQGNIWISTLFGLSEFNPQNGQVVNYYKSDGIGGNQFNERSSYHTKEGVLVFGATHGLTFFNPAESEPKRAMSLVFENLKVNNRNVSPQNSRSISRGISFDPDITLRHNENSFTLSFTALDYSEFDRVRYFYKMEGFDHEWIDAGSNREAYYSNLPAGKYLFHVKATNKDNTQSEAENIIKVNVLHAPAKSTPAVITYIILFAVVAFFAIRLRMKVVRDRYEALQIKHQKEQEEEINKMNMRFFANVSHEFRTPLTMIAGPLNTLCDDHTIRDDNKKMLYIMQRSVNRMLKLVSQLMDFNKLEEDTLQLHVRRVDIISELLNMTDIFRINADNKNIRLQISGLEDSLITWIDTDKLDKIIGNLLSNAMKFTPAGGSIKIALDIIRQNIVITVSDTGVGIPADKLERVFDRYYQIVDNDSATLNTGTGIGLYYVRKLAHLHHGTITATSNAEGLGTTFTLTLPMSDTAYSDTEKVEDKHKQDEVFPLQTREQLGDLPQEENNTKEYKILVVDDDTEVGHYLSTFLSAYYKVIVRFNADTALRTIEEEAPDLIISDVIMPNVSGYELCNRIKTDIQLCHIPVILLTAKADTESQVVGLDNGADAYVSKPFDPQYLLALIRSQLKNREHMRNLLVHKTQTDKLGKNTLSPQDKAFMTELYRLMETGLSNSELNIQQITEALHISRTKLYYKIKGLTGVNPNVFFKTYRLNRAAELLREGKLNISEIADLTGFSTLPHFSANFKKQFGVSPSKYV
ncbi:MAG: response regulator [Mediterranea sp.]|jgi:signal transduction histidine kinase/DNA-binding response OmpR family regulator/ligand-binding sensor domain-containing protein|nr:response regulator [Mediterranea sp.]